MSLIVREQSITGQGTIRFTPHFQANICEQTVPLLDQRYKVKLNDSSMGNCGLTRV